MTEHEQLLEVEFYCNWCEKIIDPTKVQIAPHSTTGKATFFHYDNHMVAISLTQAHTQWKAEVRKGVKKLEDPERDLEAAIYNEALEHVLDLPSLQDTEKETE